jgi:hypothetical protein
MNHKLKYIKERKAKKFVVSRRTLLFSIAITTSTIVLVIIWVLGSIYIEDKPNFVPKETRGAIREGIKENIAIPLAETIPSVGVPFVESAFTASDITIGSANQASVVNSEDSTADWPTYRNTELGFEIKYPKDFVYTTGGEVGNKYVNFRNKNLPISIPPDFSVEIKEDTAKDETEWLNLRSAQMGVSAPETSIIKTSEGSWLKALEVGDPDHYLYVTKRNNKIYIMLASLEFTEFEDALKSFKMY